MKKLLLLIIFLIPIIFIISCPISKPPIYEPRVTNCNPYNPEFTKRAYHTISGYIYLIGGTSDGITGLNDVWYFKHDVGWQILTPNAGFSGRWGHTSVEKDNKIWVIGGTPDGSTGLNDVWYSEDGVDWQMVTSSAGFSGRWGHTSVVKDNKIWVIGGTENGTTGLNDVWYSENGVDWILATSNAGFSGRWYHTSILYKMLVIGGTGDGINGLNDVWSSEDGITWKQETGNAGFNKRYGHKCIVTASYDLSIFVWVIGGRDGDTFYNDIWWTRDEKTWNKIKYNCPFNPRIGFEVLRDENYFLVYGGYDGINYLNDEWSIYFQHVDIRVNK